jgi:hypothetical protein
MPTTPEGLAGHDWAACPAVPAAIPERSDNPEWHSLRLFGRGRHPRAFVAGAETHDQL